MTSIDVKDATSKCSLSSINNKQSGVDSSCPMIEGNDASDLPHLQVNSATIYLLKKAASGIPLVANVLWGMLQDFGWDENITGIIEGMNAQALAEVGSAILSSTISISPYFHSALTALQSINDFEDSYSHDISAQDDELPVTSDVSDSSSCEQNMELIEGGLMFRSADFNTDESAQRLDYVITQVDISRMARTASRQLHQLPTITYYRAENPLICSSHEEENVDDFLLRNAHIIEDYFDNTEDNTEHKCQEEDPRNEPSQFSWMMVPKDPKEDNMTRMSHSIQAEEVPDSISICRSNASVSMECNMHDSVNFEYCVICQEPFQDGECLRVLPCQHLFHCGCIDKWISGKNSSDYCIISGCPMCKKTPLKTPPQQEVLDDYAKESQDESYLARLGNLSSHSESPSSD